MTAPNRVGRPPKPDGKHDYIGFKATKEDAKEFRAIYPEGQRSEPFQSFLAWLLRKPGAELPERPPAENKNAA